jgi:ribosomal protein L7Ae-like RNA K-turn-binding protein
MSIVEDLSKKTVMEIRSYAKKNNIDLFGVSTKAHMLEVIASWTPKEELLAEPKAEKPVNEKVALFSERNIFWSGVGEIVKGYNIVTKEVSEKWLTTNKVRIATPQEVAKHYGK